MRVKSLLLTIVINVFLMLFASILMEYVNLSERFSTLENTFQIALDSAIGVATGSEEMFSDEFNELQLSSYASGEDTDISAFSTTLLWRGNRFFQVNSYSLSQFYQANGRLPVTAGEMMTLTDNSVKDVFEWLYGPAESDYNHSSLTWANRNYNTRQAYSMLFGASGSSSSRGTKGHYNQDFVNYYKYVGSYQNTAGYLKRKNGNSYYLQMMRYPTLYNMGFDWMTQGNPNVNPGAERISTSVDSDFTADNFVSTLKVGKLYHGMYGKNTSYFLTPMSLDVTYIPVEVLKPVMLANLETLVRLNKIASGNGWSTVASGSGDYVDILNSADDCASTSVYHENKSGDEYAHHQVKDDELIVSDGNVEYDLNSLKVKVDYFYVDFGDTRFENRNEVLISKLQGCLSAWETSNSKSDDVNVDGATQNSLRRETLAHFREQDSSKSVTDSTYWSSYQGVKDQRIVARVSAKIKVHVPYQSAIMQWMCERSGIPGHYDIKLWGGTDTGRVKLYRDGLWYQYTTYFMKSR